VVETFWILEFLEKVQKAKKGGAMLMLKLDTAGVRNKGGVVILPAAHFWRQNS
jgi:hypothetical protein